jgi:type IV pilus assembly protein PilW
MIINTTYTKRLKSNTKSQHLALQKGFSLIELMISITIGLLIMVALGSLFLNINRANNEMAKTNSQIENGRFAIQLLQEDIVHAGYWGAYVPQFDDLTITGVPRGVPTEVPSPCLAHAAPWTTVDITNLIGVPIQVYGATPPLGAGCVTDLAANKKASTDVLVVRHAETCVPGEANCEVDTAGKLYFQASQCEIEIAASMPYKLGTSAFDLHKRNCVGTGAPPALPITAGTIAEKRKFISNIYYIRDYAQTVGDGIPTLMLSSFDLAGGTLAHQEAVPLIEGIESFHVELGIDSLSDTNEAVDYTAAINWADPINLTSPKNRGDGVPNGAFVKCTDAALCTDAQLTNVVAVKIYVLARADKVSPGYTDTKTYSLGSTVLGPFNDGFKRHVFSTTVRLINVSSRRETP